MQGSQQVDLVDLGDLIDGLLDAPPSALDEADELVSPACPDNAQVTQCWGTVLKGDSGSRCTPGFTSGKAHFKNKFCANCRACVDLPATRVRAMRDEMKPLFTNSLKAGFWKSAPDSLGGGEVRIANNTITCDGPWLIVYKDLPPELPWETMPDGWVVDGVVRLSVAKGTLVPSSEMWRQPGRGGPSLASGASGQDSAPKRRRRANGANGAASSSSFSASPGGITSPSSLALGSIKLASSGFPPPIIIGSGDGAGMPTSSSLGCASSFGAAASSGGRSPPPLPSTPAAFGLALAAAHSEVASLLQAALQPDCPLRQQLSAEQAASLHASLNSTRAALAEARQLAGASPLLADADGDATMGLLHAGSAPPLLSTLPSCGASSIAESSAAASSVAENSTCTSPRALASPRLRQNDGAGAGGHSSPEEGSSPSRHQVLPAAAGARLWARRDDPQKADGLGEGSTASSHSRSDPAIFRDRQASRRRTDSADGSARNSEARNPPPNAHFSDRLRRLGHSDSRLHSQPNRIKSLRAGLKRMFVSGGSWSSGIGNLVPRRGSTGGKEAGGVHAGRPSVEADFMADVAEVSAKTEAVQ